MKQFADKLRELRIEKSLTQTQLAKELEVTQSSIAKWETGERFPNIEILISIAKFFNCSIDYLVGLEN